VEYKNAGFFSGTTENGTYVDFINFQLKIFEGSGDIEMHMGPYSLENPQVDFDGNPGPIMGFVQGLDLANFTANGEVELLDGSPLKPAIITSFTDSYITWPIPENTVYRFSTSSTGIHDENTIKQIAFYHPNPSTEFVTLIPGLSNKITSNVSVINAEGVVVKTEKNPERIELDGLPAGIYVLKFQTDSGMIVQRILHF
jgi:hypothetical protein